MLVRLSLFAVIVFFTYMFISFRLQTNANNAGSAEFQQKIDDISAYINELEADLEAPFDHEYVEKVAREKLGMYYPQEIIYYSEEDN